MSWERGAGRGAPGPRPPGPLCSLQPPCQGKGRILPSSAFPAGAWDILAASMSPGQGRGPYLLPITSSCPCPCKGLSSPGPARILTSTDVWGHRDIRASRQGAELSRSCLHPCTCAPLTIPKRLPWPSSAQGAPCHPQGPCSPLCPPHGSSGTMLGEGRGAPYPNPPGCLLPGAGASRVSAGARWQVRLLEFDFQINHKPG